MIKIFIDGKEGTTGLKIYDRLALRDDVELITLPEEKRKDVSARREALNSCDAAFLCLPDAAAREAVTLIENPAVRVLDTSTAHRVAPGWDYGFPELSSAHWEAVARSKRVAVPGCHASGFVSLVYPLVKAGLLAPDAPLSCFSLTGYSGGGKKMIAAYEAPERDKLFDAPRAYGLTQTHKHLPEMAVVCGLSHPPVFQPVVADYYSGMLVSVGLPEGVLRGGAEDVKAVYKELYAGPVVFFREAMDENGFLSASALSGLDKMEITVLGSEGRLTLESRFDNLGKGASGAALECLNIMLNLPPTTGLKI